VSWFGKMSLKRRRMSKAAYVIAEGYSENGFLKKLLAEPLGLAGVALHVPIVGKANRKGGLKFRSFDEICREAVEFLTSRQAPYVTTFFDYYGLPTANSGGWDFVAKAKAGHSTAAAAADEIQQRFHSRVTSLIGRDDVANRFNPYIQVHELEALYFSQPDVLAQTLGDPTLTSLFDKIVSQCSGCENINDSPDTAPSKRIEKLCSRYKKGRSTMAHAPRLGGNLSLVAIRSACPRFDAWVSRLESAAQ
jgi:hypothetical protein